MIITYDRLWKLLKSVGLKKKDLAEMANIHPSTISRMGNQQGVSSMVIIKICAALNCDLSDIARIKRISTH
jgi:putative transcriptional regulator